MQFPVASIRRANIFRSSITLYTLREIFRKGKSKWCVYFREGLLGAKGLAPRLCLFIINAICNYLFSWHDCQHIKYGTMLIHPIHPPNPISTVCQLVYLFACHSHKMQLSRTKNKAECKRIAAGGITSHSIQWLSPSQNLQMWMVAPTRLGYNESVS